MELLKTLRANSPVFPNDSSQIFYVNKSDTINVGFKKLIDNNILSVPVYDESKKRFTSYLSMTDLVHEILDITNNINLPEGDINTVLNTLTEKNLFKKDKVSDIADMSKMDPFITVESEKSLDQVLRLMVKNEISKVAVLDHNNQLCNVICASRIVECVSHLFGMDSELTKLGQRPVSALNIIKRDVISVKTSDKALRAFELIAQMGISGVAVVDANDPTKIVGVISNNDLKLIKSHAQYLTLLYLPVKEYIQALKKLVVTPKDLITCKETDPFREIVEKITGNHIHRIFVVDDNQNLRGIITLQSILEQIVLTSQATPSSQ
ncbi:hypothetical protein DLAC_01245 [Tieghemostelium lacteum]|uniref:CBS domain-containing protein n=1 Tax=Tieghemostelium lacteum TaxID=361077 RepID=A0A152A868_TIELA|nr:hypothetical protein DLAC_01245 [Tieghemostelium lacteum]|eukprot:KYR02406.1 hypothetical protein DLAC_01245 [Tieghemostelium lacteum]